MEDGDLAWRFENSQYCTEGMVESTWWEVTKNEHGGILCRDFAVDIKKKGCKHCPLMDEPFWTNTVWDKKNGSKNGSKNGRKNGMKNGNRDDDLADDLANDLLADDLLANDLLPNDLLADDFNLDKDDEKEDEDVVGKDDEA